MPRKIRKKTLRKRRRKTYGSGFLGRTASSVARGIIGTNNFEYIKSARRGTRVQKINEKQINNPKIPFYLALMKYYLDFMWGKDARPIKEDAYGNKGKGIFPIPFPGEIFHSAKDGAGQGLDGKYVCIQSCIGSLNPTEGGTAPVPSGENSVKNMVINGSISLKSIPAAKLGSFEKLLKEFEPNTKTDYTDNNNFVKMYQKLYDQIAEEAYEKYYNSNDKIIWGIPLIKLKYLKNEEEFEADKEKYREYDKDIVNFEKYKEKYKECRKIEAFTMKEIDIFDAGKEEDITKNLEKEMNYENEDSMRRRYGILDLKDSNHIVYEEKTPEDKEKTLEDKEKTPNDTPPMPSPSSEDDKDDNPKLEQESEEIVEEESSPPKGIAKEIELITSTIKKYLKCPTLEASEKKALKDCRIDSNGRLSKYVSNFLKQVLNVDHTDEDLDRLIKSKIDEGIIYFHKGKILIKENYTVTVRKPKDKRLNKQMSETKLPEKLYYLKNNKWNTQSVEKWPPNSFDELKNENGDYNEDIPILSTILLVNPTSSNKVAYISWKDIDIERIKNNDIESLPWLSITRKSGSKDLKDYTFIDKINGKSSVWIGGGIKASVKSSLRKFTRSNKRDSRALNKLLGRALKERLYSSIIDEYTINKNWTYKIGDIFLWVGNEHLYVKRQPNKEKYKEYRKSTSFDTNTFHRVPQKGSYCIVVGYGVDILYTSEGNENKKGEIEKISEYGNDYKHNFLLNQGGSDVEEPKYLLEGYDDEISSRFVYGKKEQKYRWAKYDKDDYFDEKTGDTSYNEEEISDYQNREKTPNKRCYYIVESTKDIQDKAKICKVYVDEANIWGVNSNRFTRAFRLDTQRFGFFGRNTKTDTVGENTQKYIENIYNKYYNSYTSLVKEKKGGNPEKTEEKSSGEKEENSPDKTKEKTEDKTEEKSEDKDCESKYTISTHKWHYKNDPNEILDRMDFLRTLPCSLYNYFVCIFMIIDEHDDDEKKLKHMIKFFEDCENDKKIYYRYPRGVSYYEDNNTFYFKRKYIKPYLKDKKNYISSKFTDLESFSLLSEEKKDEFERLFKTLVNPDECYSITETPSKDVIEDTREIGTTEEMFKLYPEIKKITDEGDFLQNYINKLKDPLDISDIKSFTQYGIELEKWIEENKKFSMPFIATNRKDYMGFPAFANIIKNTYSKTHHFKIYTFGYYMYRKIDGSQTLEWIDKHMSLEDYNKTLESQEISDSRIEEYKKKIKDKKKRNPKKQVVHAPLIIICDDGKYYIPPTCFNINPYTEAYIKHKFPGITIKRFTKEYKDIRKYCHDFLEEWKKNCLLIVDNIDLTETYSDDINDATKPIYNLDVYGMGSFSQYNSKRKILPVNNERSLMIEEGGLSESIQSIIDMKQNTYTNTKDTTGFSDVDATISNEPFAEIFESTVREFKPIDKEYNFLYYDFWHFSNILERMEDFAKDNQGALADKAKKAAVITQKITDLQNIHRFGIYDGVNLFFIDDNGCNFFKYLFIKYKNDIKIFDEPPAYSKPLVYIIGSLYNTLFYRWGRADLNKIPLLINKNAMNRINMVMNKSESLVKFYGPKVKKAIEPGTPILKMFKIILRKVEDIRLLAKNKGWLDNAFEKFNNFLITLATTRSNVDGAIDAVNFSSSGEEEVEEVEGGGLRKRTTKKYKKNIRKTLKKNKRLKRTNKRQKRTNKRLKRTNKKEAYNP